MSQQTEVCPLCGRAYMHRLKWNGGNPKYLWLPDCTCEEDRTLNQWTNRERMARGRQE